MVPQRSGSQRHGRHFALWRDSRPRLNFWCLFLASITGTREGSGLFEELLRDFFSGGSSGSEPRGPPSSESTFTTTGKPATIMPRTCTRGFEPTLLPCSPCSPCSCMTCTRPTKHIRKDRTVRHPGYRFQQSRCCILKQGFLKILLLLFAFREPGPFGLKQSGLKYSKSTNIDTGPAQKMQTSINTSHTKLAT